MSDLLHFQDKAALVTGASSGMGLATARAFAQGGACVMHADAKEEAAQASRHSGPTQNPKATNTMNKEPSLLKKTYGDFSPKLVEITDDVLFGDAWERAELSKRDRSLVTVTALIAGGNTEQLPFHLNRAKENGVTETEIIETITHLAFYGGWPKAMSALAVAKNTFQPQPKP